MVRKEYSAGGVKHPFWFLEFKKAAILRDQGVTWEELRTRSREENLFSAASPARAEMTCNTVEARMQTLPDSFLPMFVFGDPATQKLFCLLGCMGNDDFGMPAWKPVIKIDYLFAYPQKGWRVISTQTVQSLLSDHLPIITELEYVKEASKKKY